jgi:hypothetical protein
LAATLNNANSITGNLKKNNDSITATISSIKRAADKFSDWKYNPLSIHYRLPSMSLKLY